MPYMPYIYKILKIRPPSFTKLNITLPETNIARENRPSQKDPKGTSSSNHPFAGAMLVSGRVIHFARISTSVEVSIRGVQVLAKENSSGERIELTHA